MGVYKKKNRWYADFYVDGKRKREVVKLKGIPPEHINRLDALKFLAIKKAEVAQGVYVKLKTKPVPFEKLVSAFIDGYSKTNKKSWARDVTSCKILSEYFGGKRLSQITPWLVDKYKSKRLKDVSRRKGTVSKATINRELAYLKKMLSYAHTYASNLVMAGVDIATVQELLGHKSINMTKRYSHPTLEHKKRAVEKIKSAVTDTSLDTKVIDIKAKSDVSS